MKPSNISARHAKGTRARMPVRRNASNSGKATSPFPMRAAWNAAVAGSCVTRMRWNGLYLAPVSGFATNTDKTSPSYSTEIPSYRMSAIFADCLFFPLVVAYCVGFRAIDLAVLPVISSSGNVSGRKYGNLCEIL
jgi:hypothetical protein